MAHKSRPLSHKKVAPYNATHTHTHTHTTHIFYLNFPLVFLSVFCSPELSRCSLLVISMLFLCVVLFHIYNLHRQHHGLALQAHRALQMVRIGLSIYLSLYLSLSRSLSRSLSLSLSHTLVLSFSLSLSLFLSLSLSVPTKHTLQA